MDSTIALLITICYTLLTVAPLDSPISKPSHDGLLSPSPFSLRTIFSFPLLTTFRLGLYSVPPSMLSFSLVGLNMPLIYIYSLSHWTISLPILFSMDLTPLSLSGRSILAAWLSLFIAPCNVLKEPQQ